VKTVDDFFRKYRLDEFYEKQTREGVRPVVPFRRDRHKHLSYGIIPGFRKYDLFYERYFSAVRVFEQAGVLRDGMHVLDIGSGEGFFKFFFDGMLSVTAEWHGVEVWPERAAFCQHIGYRMYDINLDEEALPFADNRFDLVIASHVIEHLRSPSGVLREMSRVTKPSGLLLVATPTKPPVIARVAHWLRTFESKKTGETQQAFSAWSLRRYVLDALQWPPSAIIDLRGFRIFSSRKKLPIENWLWFYRLSIFAGRYLLPLVPEVNIILRKP